MRDSDQIIGSTAWLDSPAGQHLLAWEQAVLDDLVANLFGYHALQVGLPTLDALRSNRMPHRWCGVSNTGQQAWPGTAILGGAGAPVACRLLPECLPFPERSIDLCVLPHTLELCEDPHAALAEAVRVLRPEGHLVVVGFNPVSLWGLERWPHRHARAVVAGDELAGEGGWLPRRWLLPNRVRDWLRLLNLEMMQTRQGGYRPAFARQAWLDRCAWMDRAGSRWWPLLGGVVVLHAVKRVRGMRLVGRIRPSKLRAAAPAPALVRPAASSRHVPGSPDTVVPHSLHE
ncbi:class I SAM-dependent methyltransferase [Ideonella livida]|uniref:Class I SAM-dependent methyltransferase n=1 Tax=Ideonella livida TaxID=2707176 RepID=A0A7C9THN4_9BURK|nr:class I SAM-dependent methyltransferase [Ideonella livida]NDY90620.1 class I SAM-dependent methyltransferase [Ideonella livida]